MLYRRYFVRLPVDVAQQDGHNSLEKRRAGVIASVDHSSRTS
jgi:hypothetical protein